MYFRIVFREGGHSGWSPDSLRPSTKRASWVSTSGLPRAGVVTVVATGRPEAPASEVVMVAKHGVARG